MYGAVIGIDPGKSGAAAIIYNKIVDVIPLPITEDDLNVHDFVSWIKHQTLYDAYIGGIPVIAYIEKTWNVSQGSIAVAKLNFIAGMLHGALRTLDIPTHKVASQTWKKWVLGNYRATKEDAIQYCNENFPSINLIHKPKSSVPDHNFADALCIADYARKFHSQENIAQL